jgi:gluconolactonase
MALIMAAVLAGTIPAQAAKIEVIEANAFYPEGPIMLGGKLYYAEMTADRVRVWDGKTTRTFWEQRGCGPTSIAPVARKRLLVTCHIAERIVLVSRKGKTVKAIDKDIRRKPIGDANDSIADGKGGAYFSSSGLFRPGAPATGAVYHYSARGRVTRVASGIRYSNGVVLTPDGKHLVVSAHLGRYLLSYPIRRGGRLGKPKVFASLETLLWGAPVAGPLAGPDGIAFDAKGNLFVAEYGAGRILVIGPKRHLAKVIPVPGRFVTNVTFAADGRTLYVTAPESNTKWPLKGKVLRIRHPLE